MSHLLSGWNRTARDEFGQPIDGASVEVRVAKDPSDEDAGTIEKPTLYADAFEHTTKPNPFTTPTDGAIIFYVPTGVYHVIVSDGTRTRVYHNEQIGYGPAAFRRVRSILSRTNGGPPASPALDDAYIVDSATGDWSSFSVDDLAIYKAGKWTNITPDAGYGPIWVDDEAVSLRYTASDGWAQTSGGGGGTVTPDRYLALINDVAEARDSAGRALARYESVHYDPFVGSSSAFLISKTDTEIDNELLQMTVYATVYGADKTSFDHKVVAGATGAVTDSYTEPDDSIRGLAVSKENQLFSISKDASTSDQVLRKYDGNGGLLVSIKDSFALEPFTLGPSTIYARSGLSGSFVTFDRDWANKSAATSLPVGSVLDMLADDNDDVFIAAGQAFKYDNTRSRIWRNPFNYTAFEAITVDGSNNQYVGRRDGVVGNSNGDEYSTSGAVTAIAFNPNGRVIAGTQEGHLLQLDASLGSFLDTQVAGGSPINAIEGDGNNYTFVACGDGVVRKHDSNGGLLASYDTGDAECLTIARNGNGKIFVGTEATVFMLSSTLSLDYQSSLPASAGAITANGSDEAFVGLANGDVVHIFSTGSQINSRTVSSATDGTEKIVGAGITGNGNVFMATSGDRAELLDGSDITDSAIMTITVASIENAVGTGTTRLGAFAASATSFWLSFLHGETREFDGNGDDTSAGYTTLSPTLKLITAHSDGSACYFGTDKEGTIAKLDGATGESLWVVKTRFTSFNEVTAIGMSPDETTIYAGTTDNKLFILDTSGTVLDSFDIGQAIQEITVDAFGALYYVDTTDDLVKMDMNSKPNDEWRNTSLDWGRDALDAITIPEATATAKTRTEALAYTPAAVHLYRSTENIKAGGSIVFTAEDADGNTKTLSDGENDVSNFTSPDVFATITFTRNDDFSGPRLLEYGLLWKE